MINFLLVEPTCLEIFVVMNNDWQAFPSLMNKEDIEKNVPQKKKRKNQRYSKFPFWTNDDAISFIIFLILIP